MDKPSFYKNFTGTVDELLAHCDKLDANAVEKAVEDKSNDILSPEECVAVIQEDFKVSKEEAEKIRMEIALEEVDETIKSLVEKGYLELDSYDKELNPKYIPTEKGRKELNWK